MADSDSTPGNKRPRVDSDESPPESPEAKRICENLLGILDEEDALADRALDPATQDLVTFMKSFEEEIGLSVDSVHPLSLMSESASDSGESQPELGFLLEASDDELGLPPTTSGAEEKNGEAEGGGDILRGPSEAVGFGHMWGFEDEIPCYDALHFGIRTDDRNEEEPVVFGGLFDYPDDGSGPLDFSDFSWRQESLPAL